MEGGRSTTQTCEGAGVQLRGGGGSREGRGGSWNNRARQQAVGCLKQQGFRA